MTADHVNPERAWPALDVLRAATEAGGHTLAPRLTIYPEFAHDPERFLDAAMRFAVLDRSDAEGLARDAAWCSGGEIHAARPAPPPPVAPARVGPVGPARGARWARCWPGWRSARSSTSTRSSPFSRPGGPRCGPWPRWPTTCGPETVGDEVTFVNNRNINYTNVCTFKCQFCAFSKGPLSLNLRGDPYLLELDEITRRVAEAEAEGATEVCLQGGIHPKFDGDYYVDVLAAVRAGSERIHIHGFTALEVTEGARRLGVPLTDYLVRLKEAGLKTLPGTAAEILDDEVRAVLCPDKINTEEWLEAHRAPTPSVCAPTSPSCSGRSSSRSRGPGT